MSAEPDAAAFVSPLIETVTTTRNPDGTVNCAAMGVRFGEDELVMWPFAGTRTLRNLRERPAAVVHLTDDVLLFVRSALGRPRPATRPAGSVDGAVIDGVAGWREVRVLDISPTADELPRFQVRARVLGSGIGSQPPAGLCRARHAAVEASILASRVRFLGAGQVAAELDRLAEIVVKTGGPREHAALELVRDHLAGRPAEPS